MRTNISDLEYSIRNLEEDHHYSDVSKWLNQFDAHSLDLLRALAERLVNKKEA